MGPPSFKCRLQICDGAENRSIHPLAETCSSQHMVACLLCYDDVTVRDCERQPVVTEDGHQIGMIGIWRAGFGNVSPSQSGEGPRFRLRFFRN
jgi:hypothetical protein